MFSSKKPKQVFSYMAVGQKENPGPQVAGSIFPFTIGFFRYSFLTHSHIPAAYLTPSGFIPARFQPRKKPSHVKIPPLPRNGAPTKIPGSGRSEDPSHPTSTPSLCN